MDELASGLAEAKLGLLDELTHVLVDLVCLLVVVFLGPTTDGVSHTVVLSWDALSVHLIKSYGKGKMVIQERGDLKLRMSWRNRSINHHGGASLFKPFKFIKSCNLRDAPTVVGCCRG